MIFADIALMPETYVATSIDGRSYIKMIPGEDGYRCSGYGMAYAATEAGTDSLLWRLEDCYTSSVHISNSGEYLVWEGSWAESPLSDAEIAVAFYKNGKLLNSYAVTDLVEDTSKISYSVSHYIYREFTHFDEYRSSYNLVTIDKNSYQFDITTGKITSVKRVGLIDEFLRAIDNRKAITKYLIMSFLAGIVMGIFLYALGRRILLYKRNAKTTAS